MSVTGEDPQPVAPAPAGQPAPARTSAGPPGATAPAPPAGPAPRGAPAAPGGTGWGPAVGGQAAALASELADRVIDAVAWLRARTTVKVVTALRALVYGSVALVSLVTAAVLGILGVVRIWDAYVPVHPAATRVWLGYVVFGAALFFPGAWLVLSRRAAKKG